MLQQFNPSFCLVYLRFHSLRVCGSSRLLFLTLALINVLITRPSLQYFRLTLASLSPSFTGPSSVAFALPVIAPVCPFFILSCLAFRPQSLPSLTFPFCSVRLLCPFYVSFPFSSFSGKFLLYVSLIWLPYFFSCLCVHLFLPVALLFLLVSFSFSFSLLPLNISCQFPSLVFFRIFVSPY